MNSQSKHALQDLCCAIQALAQGVMLTTGIETCTDVMNKAENLKIVLEKDETITEVR